MQNQFANFNEMNLKKEAYKVFIPEKKPLEKYFERV